ncbi:MAG: cyanophycinase [Candidatus Competibacterales bacterium]
MKRWILTAALSMLGLPGITQANGTLMVVGGGDLPEVIYDEFIALATQAAGGPPVVCIFGTNSFDPEDSRTFYKPFFEERGAAVEEVLVTVQNSAWNTEPLFVGEDGRFLFDDPEDEVRLTEDRLVEDPAVVTQVMSCDAFWFGGGNQNRSSVALLNQDGSDTPVAAALRAVVTQGGVFGGTSAGAAIQSDPMIVAGASYDSLITPQGPLAVGTGPGLGLVPEGLLIDQHVFVFGRLGRLFVAMEDLGLSLGAGADNSTAIVFDLSANNWRVVGTGHVVILERDVAVAARQANLHLLGHGDVYDLNDGQVTVNGALADITGDPFFPSAPVYQLGAFNPTVIPSVVTELVDTIDQTQGAAIDFIGEPSESYQAQAVQLNFTQTDATQAFLCFSSCRADNVNRSGSTARYSVADMALSFSGGQVVFSATPSTPMPPLPPDEPQGPVRPGLGNGPADLRPAGG